MEYQGKLLVDHCQCVFLIYLLAEQGLAVCKAVIAKYNLLNELGIANVSKDRPLQVGHDVVHNIGDTQ